MSWAEEQLKAEGWIPAAAAWLPRDTAEPQFRTLDASAAELSVAEQERLLSAELVGPWGQHQLAAMLLAAPVIYGRKGSPDRAEAVRLHVEAATGYCADILMPYRIRPARPWRRSSRNRVHFSQPVAQESDSFAPWQDDRTNADKT